MRAAEDSGSARDPKMIKGNDQTLDELLEWQTHGSRHQIRYQIVLNWMQLGDAEFTA